MAISQAQAAGREEGGARICRCFKPRPVGRRVMVGPTPYWTLRSRAGLIGPTAFQRPAGMPMRAAVPVIALAAFTSSCGGSNGTATGGGTDYSANFVGTWYVEPQPGGGSVTVNGVVTPIPAGTSQVITESATNRELSLAGLCVSGASVTATVTGPDTSRLTITVLRESRPARRGGASALTQSFMGSGQLSPTNPIALTTTFSGVTTACGNTASFSETSTATQTPLAQ